MIDCEIIYSRQTERRKRSLENQTIKRKKSQIMGTVTSPIAFCLIFHFPLFLVINFQLGSALKPYSHLRGFFLQREKIPRKYVNTLDIFHSNTIGFLSVISQWKSLNSNWS